MDLPSLPQDKANHLAYGAAIAAAGACVSVWWGLLLCAAAAVAKELSDWWQNARNGGQHGVEFGDALATMAGGVIVLLPWFVKMVK